MGSFESETPNGTIQIGQDLFIKPMTGFANFNSHDACRQ
jgi:hypothetical protein